MTTAKAKMRKKCPICDGIGTIVYKGYKLRCPNCNNGITTVY